MVVGRVTEVGVTRVHVLRVRGCRPVRSRLWSCRGRSLVVGGRRGMVHKLVHEAVARVVQHVVRVRVLSVLLHQVVGRDGRAGWRSVARCRAATHV